MARQRMLAITLVLGVLTTPVSAQPARNVFAPAEELSYKYAVTPQAGPWLICVQTFKGPQAQRLAEELAELLMRDYKVAAYLQDWGRKQRAEEKDRVEKLKEHYRGLYKQMQSQGLQPTDGIMRFRVPVVSIDDEFAVLICKANRQLKDMDAARDYLNDIRKFKALPEKFSLRAVVFGDDDKSRKERDSAYINPFLTAMVVHNPTVPMKKEQDDPTKADKLLKDLNEDETYSVLKTSKPWTLVVKVYQGQSVVQASGGPVTSSKFSPGRKDGETYLNALCYAGAFHGGFPPQKSETGCLCDAPPRVQHCDDWSVRQIGRSEVDRQSAHLCRPATSR